MMGVCYLVINVCSPCQQWSCGNIKPRLVSFSKRLQFRLSIEYSRNRKKPIACIGWCSCNTGVIANINNMDQDPTVFVKKNTSIHFLLSFSDVWWSFVMDFIAARWHWELCNKDILQMLKVTLPFSLGILYKIFFWWILVQQLCD